MMIGRVAWTGTDRIGVHVRDRIAIEDLLQPVTPGRKTPRSTAKVQMRLYEQHKPTVAERADASNRFARAFNFIAIAIVAAGLAAMASGVASQALAEPLAQVGLVLDGKTN